MKNKLEFTVKKVSNDVNDNTSKKIKSFESKNEAENFAHHLFCLESNRLLSGFYLNYSYLVFNSKNEVVS
jgi:hypothetical protein